MQTILITGGAGFIGSHTTLFLLELGYKVIVIDSFINSTPSSLKRINQYLSNKNIITNNNFEIIKGDIRCENTLNNIFLSAQKEKRKIDAVIHFAGLKSVPESFIKKSEYWDNNVNGSINLFKVMDKYNCRYLVFSSSAAVYASFYKENIKENSKLLPNSPYGKTKLAVENIIKDLFLSSNNWSIIVLRYFNPIGAHSSQILGESPLVKPSNIFPYLLEVASRKRDVLDVFGNNWETSDGTTVRDYIHINDLVDGHVKALKFALENKRTLLHLNLGLGKGTSILELIDIFEKYNNCEIPYRYKNRRIGDIAIRIASNKMACEILNWKPQKNISEMCIDGWKWQIKNQLGY